MHEHIGYCKTGNQNLEMAGNTVYLHDGFGVFVKLGYVFDV